VKQAEQLADFSVKFKSGVKILSMLPTSVTMLMLCKCNQNTTFFIEQYKIDESRNNPLNAVSY